MNRGFFKLHRRIFTHWLWKEPRSMSKFEAFMDLLQLAAFEPTKRLVSGKFISVPIGGVVASERFLSERWKWSRTKIRNFLRVLQEDDMIELRKDQQETIVCLLNYESYNTTQTAKEPPTEPVGDRRETGGRPNIRTKEGEERECQGPTRPTAYAFADNHPTATAAMFDGLQVRINALIPPWTKRPAFTDPELRALQANARFLDDLTETDWRLLHSYLHAVIPADWGKYWQPDKRLQFIEQVSDVMIYADRWGQQCRRLGIATELVPTVNQPACA